MKSYLYTRTEKSTKKAGIWKTEYTITLYRVIRGTPKLVGRDTDTFCSDWQQVRDYMKRLGLMPKAAMALDANGRERYYLPDQLREAGIININQV